MHEAASYKDNSFLTLTYRDKSQCTDKQKDANLHVPNSGSLVKSHHQKFMKRLRQHYGNRRIRYYQAGEYGDENNRPHYHSCLFNLAFDDEELYSENHGNPLFTSKTLEKLWSYGFATVGALSFESAAYVAGYVLKKMTGTGANDHYLRYDEYGNAYWLQPEYCTMSTGTKKGEGIGADWLRAYHEEMYPHNRANVPGVGIIRGLPRYYDELMEDINPATLDDAKQLRKTFAAANPELYTPARLHSQYLIYKANQRNREL